MSRFPANAEIAKPLPIPFPKVERCGMTPMKFLRSAEMPAKTGDHLIEDQQCPALFAEILHLLQIARLRLRCRLCLHHDACDPRRIAIK